jgi:hypothetical protein
MSDKNKQTQLRLVHDSGAGVDDSTTAPPEPKSAAETFAAENPLVRQLSALADALDRDVAALLGF